MMFTGKTQSESWVCRVPDGPFRKHFKYLKHKDVVQKIETKFLEGALGHSWEDSGHGVDPVLRVLLHHARHLHFHKTSCFYTLIFRAGLACQYNCLNLDAIGAELSSQENIHEVDVAKDVEEVDGLRDEHLERPDVVAAQVVREVAGEHL